MKPSHLLDLTNPNCELRDRLQCVILLRSVCCAVVLIYYSDVLNKVSSYTVLVESCCDALHKPELASLNQRKELTTSCRHRWKYLLCNN